MNTYAVYFKPLGALATWPLTSDTLFGAVCWGIRELGLMSDQQLTEWLEMQKEAPLFAFSHAFPYYRQAKVYLRLYPRPATFQPEINDFYTLALEWKKTKSGMTLKAAQVDTAAAGKKFKRIQYVSEIVFHQIAGGNLRPLAGLKAMLSDSGQYISKAGALWTVPEAGSLPERPEKLYETEAMQHNQIDRMSGGTVESMLFYRNETFFAPNAGLWALLRADEKDISQYIRPALSYLADTGLGADRTSGKGQFEISLEAAPALPVVNKPSGMMTLSHYLPHAGELSSLRKPLAYTLKMLHPKREQRYTTLPQENQKSAPVYKRSIRVFEPGSVFPFVNPKDVFGRLARLTPPEQEAIYQSGAALMVYLQVEM